jgi:hypothetical protein
VLEEVAKNLAAILDQPFPVYKKGLDDSTRMGVCLFDIVTFPEASHFPNDNKNVSTFELANAGSVTLDSANPQLVKYAIFLFIDVDVSLKGGGLFRVTHIWMFDQIGRERMDTRGYLCGIWERLPRGEVLRRK